MASFLTGLGTSELTGLDSVLTAAGVCAPNPDQFITDGASFKTGQASVLTADQPPSCAQACLAPGTVIFDSGVIPAEHTVNSNSAVGPNVWVEVPVAAFAGLNPDCVYQIVISMDAEDIHAGIPTDDFVINAFVGPPGAVDPTGFDSIPPGIANVAAAITNAYASYTLAPGIDTFNGPGAAESVYVWPGVNFPDFQGSQVKYKNLRIIIKAA